MSEFRAAFALFFLLLSPLFAGRLLAQVSTDPAEAKPDVSLSVILNDGGTLEGKSSKPIVLETSFGKAEIRVDRLRSLEMGDLVEVKTAGHQKLSGKLIGDSLELQTLKGLRKVSFDQVRKILAFSNAKLEPGKISLGLARNGMTYHLRVPKEYDAKKKYPSIVILHGSNMNAKMYVSTIVSAWPDIAERYVLIGINGENPSSNFNPDSPRYNYSYVNYSGKSKYKNHPRFNRESPPLVAEVIQQVRSYVAINKVFVGGHSQGGFLTYSVGMNFPEMVDGIFPVSCGLIIQCEPTAYTDDDVRAAQRKIPVAIVHAPNDTAVKYEMAAYAYRKLVEDGFKEVRMFENNGAHMFAMLPVNQAIEWLEIVTSEDAGRLLPLAKQHFDRERYRVALSLYRRAKESRIEEEQRVEIEEMIKDIQSIADVESRKLVDLITKNESNKWVSRYHRFQNQFRDTESGKAVQSVYEELKKRHERPAERLFFAARRIIQSKAKSKDEAYAMLQEIVDDYYASTHYLLAKEWLENRND